ncbi:hypothetical protein BD626DRAFT_491605 [Schizophyllum amplum]|uniref:Uncharacterized protein n=1 Tax=Schizophyllum amplum TaxID=97359 RepID=A0A550CHV3_9AGAR|nr:hypothetical protein BD626DRAFT_491605 [Auriculariopsis ampla]
MNDTVQQKNVYILSDLRTWTDDFVQLAIFGRRRMNDHDAFSEAEYRRMNAISPTQRLCWVDGRALIIKFVELEVPGITFGRIRNPEELGSDADACVFIYSSIYDSLYFVGLILKRFTEYFDKTYPIALVSALDWSQTEEDEATGKQCAEENGVPFFQFSVTDDDEEGSARNVEEVVHAIVRSIREESSSRRMQQCRPVFYEGPSRRKRLAHRLRAVTSSCIIA